MMVETREPTGQEPKAPPAQGYCRACGGWIVTGPAGVPWLRGRCGNRNVDGLSGRNCRLYGKTQTFTFTPSCLNGSYHVD